MNASRSQSMLLILVALSGLCGLSWEVLWQHHASLAIGVSARGTAITLAATLGGMALGAWLVGRSLDTREIRRPLLLYAALEIVVGLGGLALEPAFRRLAGLDARLYQAAPWLADLGQVVGVGAVLLPQALAMGATLPVFRLLTSRTGPSLTRRGGWGPPASLPDLPRWDPPGEARQVPTRLSSLYGINIAGAVLGVVTAAGILIPWLGMSITASLVAAVNVLVALGAAAMALRATRQAAPSEPAPAGTPLGTPLDVGAFEQAAAVMVTGFVTLLLEVAWFRSLRSAFHSSTEAFALMLVSVLIPLAAGAAMAKKMPPTRAALAAVLGAAGVLATLATPVIERLDFLLPVTMPWYSLQAMRVAVCLVLVGLPVLPLGTVLPFLLDRTRSPRPAGRLYGLNTLASVAGALCAGWLFLPGIGFARTAWAAGLLLVACGLWLLRLRGRRALTILSIWSLTLGAAVWAESEVGRVRTQGSYLAGKSHRVIFHREAPDATVSVVLRDNKYRDLVIDGFMASVDAEYAHYLDWMGHAPMALHPNPRRALVICFGTGRTAHAVAQERPQALDIIELSPAVLAAGRFFPESGSVLTDPRARVVVMDGRAWLRRTKEMYDVITLEPMPPYFAGTNALYSLEFYQLAVQRLQPGGVIAQWLPFHLVTPDDAASIVRTMQAVFADTYLWLDPVDRQGIVLGRRAGPSGGLPPLRVRDHQGLGRDLDAGAIMRNLLLDPQGSRRFGQFGGLITDDNQLLAYGKGRRLMQDVSYSDASHLTTLDIVFRIGRGERPQVRESDRQAPSSFAPRDDAQ